MTTIDTSALGVRHRARWAAALAAILALTGIARADTLTTTDGKVFQGKIIEQTKSGVTFEVVSRGIRARMFFPAERIATLETGLSPDELRQKAYQHKKQSLDLTAAEGWHQLGLWCAEQKMYPEAIEAFRESITRDPGYRVKSTLAQAQMEIGRNRLRTARDLLAALAAAEPDDVTVKAALANVQQRINVELRGIFEGGRAAYSRSDYTIALGVFRRIAREADAALLADITRTLAQKGEPSLAEMMVTCRLSDPLVRRSNTFETVTPLEKPLLVARLQELVEAGVRSSEAAYGAVAATPADDAAQRSFAAKRELAALDRLDALAKVGGRLAGELNNDQGQAAFRTAVRALANNRARIALLWIGTLEASAKRALATLADESVSFSRRLKASESAANQTRDGLKALRSLADRTRDLPDATAVGILAQRRRFEELDRRVNDERGHIKRIETALERGLRARDRRQYGDVILWFARLIKEANADEGRELEAIIRRRTGDDLIDIMVNARIRTAERDRRFREATKYERAALNRELTRRASQTSIRAADALRDARDAAPDSQQRRDAARRAISYANGAAFYLRGRLEIGVDHSRRERDRIDDDIDDMTRIVSEARRLLVSSP